MEYATIEHDFVSKKETLGVMYGKIPKSHDLVVKSDKLRTVSYFEYLTSLDKETYVHPTIGTIDKETREKDLDLGTEAAREFLKEFGLSFTQVNSIESTYIQAPGKHNFEDEHNDEDNYGRGITLILYPRIDSTIEGGGLFIFDHERKDRGEEHVENDPMNYHTLINPRCEDADCINFVIMGGSVRHQVQEVRGTGVREAVIYFLSTVSNEEQDEIDDEIEAISNNIPNIFDHLSKDVKFRVVPTI